MQKKRIISLVFLLLLLGNFVFSFIQYYNTPLYGDITVSVLPNKEHVQKLLDDPFGLQVLITMEKQFNPNRYFSHLFLKEYFQNAPFFFQKFAGPISSVYLSSALVKITIQILFIFILAIFISGEKLFSRNFILSAVIIAPLFQIYGYWSRMGIVDKSVAYTFFYALPIVLLMLFFLPVFNRINNKSNLKLLHCILMAPLIIVLPFTGPLNPPVILLVSFFIFLNYWFRLNKNIKIVLKTIPKTIYILLIPINLLSVYSLFLGLFDSSFASAMIPLTRRFSALPEGIFSQLFHSPGFPLLLLMIGVNVFLMKRNHVPGSENLIRILK